MSQRTVLTIGHSTHALGDLLALLSVNGATVVTDVRSSPYSRKNPQFNRAPLAKALAARGIRYAFLGRELGARSDDPACHEHGRVSYERLARTALFQEGLDRVEEGSARYRLALLCAEKEPLECHRAILVARHLVERGLRVEHILADGKLEGHESAIDRLIDSLIGRRLRGEDLYRSREAVVEDAYRVQGERIAYAGRGKANGRRA